MSEKNSPDDRIRRFLNGELTDAETFAFLKQMEEDTLLSEEVHLMKAVMEVEREKYIAAMMAGGEKEVTAPQAPAAPEATKTIPLYRQQWFKVAASFVVLAGLGWLVYEETGPEKTTLLTAVPVRQSIDNQLGWAEGAHGEQVTTLVTRDENGTLRYSFTQDTLKIFTPDPLGSLSTKDKLYLLDDLKNRRLLLVLGGKRYPIESGVSIETPLIEEPASLP